MKFFFGLLAFIAAVVVVVLLTVSLFRGFSDANSSTPVVSTFSLTEENAINSISQYTISGPVTADENFNQVVITISQNARTIEVLNGYSNTLISTQTLPNTPEAYSAFIGALRAAEFTYMKEGVEQDPVATCVTGSKFWYRLNLDGTSKVDTWSTACSSDQGTYAGNASATARLFQVQIPNYSQVTSGINLQTP